MYDSAGVGRGGWEGNGMAAVRRDGALVGCRFESS